MLAEKLICIQCEVDRGCLAYMKYLKGGNNNNYKHGKGSCKEDIDKFFLHTYPDVGWSPAVKTAVTWSVRHLQSASSGIFVWSG